MGIDPAPFRALLFLYFFEYNYVQQHISFGCVRGCRYYVTSRFIDDLCAVNDNAEFFSSFKGFVRYIFASLFLSLNESIVKLGEISILDSQIS